MLNMTYQDHTLHIGTNHTYDSCLCEASQIVHECVRQKCGYSTKGEVRKHEEVKHEGFIFTCILCELQTTLKTFLYNHK